DDEEAARLEDVAELTQRGFAVALVEEMSEGVAEANDGVVSAIEVAAELAPVGDDGRQLDAMLLRVLLGLANHLGGAVGRGDVEAVLAQHHGVVAGAGRDVEDTLAAVLTKDAGEEAVL